MGRVNMESDAIGNSPTLSSVLKDHLSSLQNSLERQSPILQPSADVQRTSLLSVDDLDNTRPVCVISKVHTNTNAELEQGEERPGHVNLKSLPSADLDKQNGVNTCTDALLNDNLEAQRPTTSSTLETISKIQIVDTLAFQEMLSKLNPNIWREGEASGKTVYASSKSDSEPGAEESQGAVSQATFNNHFTDSWLTQSLQDKKNGSTTTESPSPPLSNCPTNSISAFVEDFVSPDSDTSSDSEWILQAAVDCYRLRERTTTSCWSPPQESPRNSISAAACNIHSESDDVSEYGDTKSSMKALMEFRGLSCGGDQQKAGSELVLSLRR
ncbi:hypothetical protein WMY93_015203 [Mugilogobius chulae]|uniref:Uncharacterized protein n=1 Tax=Mugilogobius chulae TaxID=88201 RepID=A0AAW0NZ07_9GOBI